MHASLVMLYDEAGRLGLRRRAGLEMTFSPSPEVGRAAAGADAALRSLVRFGYLKEAGYGLSACLEIDVEAAVHSRRRLLRLDPDVVALFQRTGVRWAAFASTCTKYSSSAPVSPEAIVASATA